MFSKIKVRTVLAVLGVVMTPLAAAADAFPTMPLTAYIGYRVGGGTDTIGRVIVKFMGDALGQQINVVNKTGAGGGLAALAVKNAEPDGYSFLLSSTSSLTSGPLINNNLTYAVDDFRPVALIATYQSGIIASIDAPFKTMKEYVDYARTHTTKYVMVTDLSRMMMQYIAKTDGLHVDFVPSKGGSEILNLFAGHQVDVAYSGGFHQLYKDRVRMIAAATLKRQASDPNVPTLIELGYPIALDSQLGIFVSKDVPDDVFAKLVDAAHAAIGQPQVQDILAKYQYPLDYEGPAEAKKTLAEQLEYYRKLIETTRGDAAAAIAARSGD